MVKSERLHPSSSAFCYHSFRVYYQIPERIGTLNVNTEKLGWSTDILPETMDKKPASNLLLKKIGCNCKYDWSALRCGCRKGGYHCSSLCDQCQISVCTNENIIPQENGRIWFCYEHIVLLKTRKLVSIMIFFNSVFIVANVYFGCKLHYEVNKITDFAKFC